MPSKKSERKSVGGFNAQHLADLQARGLIRGYSEMNIGVKDPQQPATSKYKNKKVEVDGKVFDSKREAARYLELRMLVTIGEVTDLECQVPFELNEGGSHSLKYMADFVYKSNGNTIVEDVKGYRTVVYKKKKRLMLKIHGIEIKET